MREYDLSSHKSFISAHYHFFYRAGSFAERDLDLIVRTQESSYEKITAILGIKPDFSIRYILCETPEEVGRIYGDNEPCNGFADLPDTVFAVHSDKISCIGPHEDTHLIAALIARPESVFIREGIAMYMDECWWGRINEEWVYEFLKENKYVSVVTLLDNECFWDISDEITYPLSGAFTHFLIHHMGMHSYLHIVYRNGQLMLSALESFFNCSIAEIEQHFLQWILKMTKNRS